MYNSKTVTSAPGRRSGRDPSSSGAARQPVRYQFQPVDVSTAGFYLYNDHFKSGTTTSRSDDSRRGAEATLLVNNAATHCGQHALVYGATTTLQSSHRRRRISRSHTGTADNHAVDPLNPDNVTQTWNNTIRYETESPATRRLSRPGHRRHELP